MKQNEIVEVRLWGTTVGYLGYAPNQSEFATFEYDKEFVKTGIQLSPIVMKYPPLLHTFERISHHTFHGLAGIFADSLPDKFGNQLIDQFMADKNIPSHQVTALDRLLYVGDRGMGALEYHPIQNSRQKSGVALDLHTLSELSNLILTKKDDFRSRLHSAPSRQDALSIIRIGSSAGGARSKALVAVDKDGKIYDGTIEQANGCRYFLLKFDSVENADRDKKDPKGMTKVEYVYSQIAKECGIDIPYTDYIVDGDDFHFLIERFDREVADGKLRKKYYASWAALAHADRDATGAYSYEQLVLTARELDIGENSIKELFRRAVFNIIGKNQDDHTKNFGFLMDRDGKWSLSPAFDMTYAYDPNGKWTRAHQIKLNGKQDGFTLDDLLAFGSKCNLSQKEVREIVLNTQEAFSTFETKAKGFGVDGELVKTISGNLRLDILR